MLLELVREPCNSPFLQYFSLCLCLGSGNFHLLTSLSLKPSNNGWPALRSPSAHMGPCPLTRWCISSIHCWSSNCFYVKLHGFTTNTYPHFQECCVDGQGNPLPCTLPASTSLKTSRCQCQLQGISLQGSSNTYRTIVWSKKGRTTQDRQNCQDQMDDQCESMLISSISSIFLIFHPTILYSIN